MGMRRALVSGLTRRAAVSGFAATAILSTGAVRRALAQPAIRFREIRVDVSRLRASAGDPTAEWVEQALPGHLSQALSAYVAPAQRNGATLLARIEDIDFGQSGGRGGTSGASQDTMRGVLIVGGPHAGVPAQTSLRAVAAYSSGAADQALVEESYHGRVLALSQAFAGWAPRELGI